MNYDIEKLKLPISKFGFSVIAGPCSAESEYQLMTTAESLANIGVKIIRAGLWKPRTMPFGFEGMGDVAIPWIQKVERELGLKVITEVGRLDHVRKLVDAGMDMFWIGARTTTNPFAIEELAEELSKIDCTVLVKNPLNPDVNLWVGAILRLQRAGVKKLAAIHRGFSSFGISDMRNPPYWQLPLTLKRMMPNITMICDPSHITGKRSMILPISQTAIDMGYDGLIIESHCDPTSALSDAAQQVSPEDLKNILSSIKKTSTIVDIPQDVSVLRRDIDHIDEELISMLSKRFEIARRIGSTKHNNNMPVLQIDRFRELLNNRIKRAQTLGLREDFVTQIFSIIHEESVHQQELNI